MFKRKPKPEPRYFSCPNCGEDVKVDARVCRNCGADEETGWKKPDYSHAFSSIDDDFDYDEFLDKEFGGKSVKPKGRTWVQWAVAVFLVAIFVIWWLRSSGLV